MENAVIYPRYSSHGQNDMTIEGQIRICTEFAHSRGLNVIKIYPEKAKSASKDTHKRKAFQQMLHDAESGAFQYIIVYKFDRFARNRFESMMIKHQLKEKCGVKVLSALEPVTDDEGGELYEMFVEWNDEKYSQRLSVRIRDGLTTSVENGTFTGSKLIFGYKLIDTDKTGKKGTIHKVAIDEKQAEIVRFVYNEYAKGTDKKDIAAALNARGERFNGKPFKGRTFDRWLTNAKYTGEYYFGGRLCANTYPPIIDKIHFAEVQKRLAKNKILAGANSAVEPYLLTGKAYCGHCGTAIVADGGTSCNGKKHYYYACKQKKKGLCHKSRENKDNLEMQVAQAVKDFLSDKKNADRAAADTIAYYEHRTGDSGLRSIETRITQAQQEVENLTNALIEAKSALLRAGIEKKMQDYETLLADLQAQKSQIELERGRQVTKQQILAFVAELIKGEPTDKEYQRKIIDNLVFMVYVYDNEIVTYLNFGVDKAIERVRLDETNTAIEGLKNVQTLSPLLHQHYGVKTIIIIDEYDTPIQQGHSKGFYDDVILFMRNLFSGGLKDNSHLAFGFLTGILRVAKESIFGGLNNLVINSILDNKYSEYFGFTAAEVKEMCEYYHAADKFDEICEWYDGYRFGKSDIFNPWSVINYFNNECEPRAFWQSTGSNDIISEVIAEADADIYERLTSLVGGKSFTTYIDTGVIYPQIKNNPSTIYSFLLVAGYLKAIKTTTAISGDFMCEVALPNKEISFVYNKEILRKLDNIIPQSTAISIQEAIYSGDGVKLQTLIQTLLTQSVSSYDTAGENFYHGFMLVLCALLGGSYTTSNRESGDGRYDIQLMPKNDRLPGIIIELKAEKNCSGDELTKLSETALKQIEDKKYDTEMTAKGVKTIYKYGVAFSGKTVKVAKKSRRKE